MRKEIDAKRKESQRGKEVKEERKKERKLERKGEWRETGA